MTSRKDLKPKLHDWNQTTRGTASSQWDHQPKVTNGSAHPHFQPHPSLLKKTNKQKQNSNTPQQKSTNNNRKKEYIYLYIYVKTKQKQKQKNPNNNKETEFQVCKNGYVTFHLGKIVKTYRVLWSIVRQALERLARRELLSDALGSSSTPSSLLSATMVSRALLAPISGRVGRAGVGWGWGWGGNHGE